MDSHYLARMKERLETMRRIASLAHDARIIELVTQAASQLEQDISELEPAHSKIVTIDLEPPPTR